MIKNPELLRLRATPTNEGWKKWGPYLSERQWGTVREDYSAGGDAWNYVSHDLSRSKAYRWGEDGIAGLSDTRQILCFALGLWNEKDPIIKERLYGLTNNEGNHGEDVKELYYYIDSTPTHSYMKMLYKYPQGEFPYAKLVQENAKRSRKDPEYELADTGIFDENRYFDVVVEYAKEAEEDICIKITAYNRGPEKAVVHLMPHLWYRNTWAWGYKEFEYRPHLHWNKQDRCLFAEHATFGHYHLYYEGNPEPIFCNNETNSRRFYGTESVNRYFKDGINNYVTTGNRRYINPDYRGTKACVRYRLEIQAGDSVSIKLRLSDKTLADPFGTFHQTFANRLEEADIFYDHLQKGISAPDLRNIQRQAYAGMLWGKQRYYYNVNQWLKGDPSMPPPPEARRRGRNAHWKHLYNANLISMPDKWEYPWYAAWDLAFHCVPLARLDPAFAKRQLVLMLREYYMHPNGQMPAYEWNFSDTNPPVHAWGAWKVYCIDKEMNDGKGDTDFLSIVFHKLLMNFTWWVNQKDTEGNNIFEGGFLGLDNIGVFDRSNPLPTGGYIEQADGTSWMAMYSLNMLRIALELSRLKPYYQETASKFFEHFLAIAGSLAHIGQENMDLWDDEDEFYYDVLHRTDIPSHRLKVRSMVGITPLFAVDVLTPEELSLLPDFKRRLEWVLRNRPDLAELVSRWNDFGKGETRMLSLLRVHRMKCTLRRMLDTDEFLSDYGIRALSKFHLEHPYRYYVGQHVFEVKYIPGESDSGMFGGNSNWRGPIWFPLNYLVIESLERFYEYYGESVRIQYPTGTGKLSSLREVAQGLAQRLIRIFTRQADGERVFHGQGDRLQKDPHFKDLVLFYEYFHGDNGKGLGASHQTGWTGLIAELIHSYGRDHLPEPTARDMAKRSGASKP